MRASAPPLLLPLLLLLALLSRAGALRSSMECVRWAQAGECVKNPRYLWAHCLAACMELARDDHDLCPRWAHDGECSKNPAYVHIHCPQACGHSIGWSPVTRKILDIEFIPIDPIFLLPHECLAHNEVFMAALTLQNRLKHIFDASVFNGISTSAPNEFLMNYGLAEAILYSLRLYDVVVKSLDDSVLNDKSEEAIAYVLSTLSYDGDYTGRLIPQCYFSLEGVRMGIIHKIGEMQKNQQQLLQKYHGLKDTYLKENFANVKANACSMSFDLNLSSIVEMYDLHASFAPDNVRPKFEYLRTLDESDEFDGDEYLLADGRNSVDSESSQAQELSPTEENSGSENDEDVPAADLTDAEVDSLMNLDTYVADDNCFNDEGERLEPALCYMLNKQRALFERARDRDRVAAEKVLTDKADGPLVQPTKVVQPYMTLLNGAKMPALGMGTWELSGLECEAAVYDAIRMGYRHIDTSQAYGNEGDIGRAIKRAIDEGIVTRNDLFISTKISFQKDSGRNVFNLVHMQLEKLKLNYIDLYMIHSHMASDTILKATWHSITQMYYDGIIRAAGVSNFNAQQLERLVDMVMKSREDEEGVDGGAQGNFLFPMVLQNKFDVYHSGKQLDHIGEDVRALCRQHDIKLIGYSPLSSFPFVMVPLADPIVETIAAKRQVPPAEEVAVIPRSSNRSHMRENLMAASKLASTSPSSWLSSEESQLLSTISSLTASPFTVVSPPLPPTR